jgi:hypothetical protein
MLPNSSVRSRGTVRPAGAGAMRLAVRIGEHVGQR